MNASIEIYDTTTLLLFTLEFHNICTGQILERLVAYHQNGRIWQGLPAAVIGLWFLLSLILETIFRAALLIAYMKCVVSYTGWLAAADC